MPATARALLIVGTLAIAPGCADRHIYQSETFESKDHHTRVFQAPPQVTLRACRNAAIQAQYVIQEHDDAAGFLRLFKSNPVAKQDDRYAGLTIEVNVSPASPQTSLVRAVAVERQYEVTKNREFAQAGIGPLLNIPLPTGETQTVTEVRRDTVDDRRFYQKLYQAIEIQLPQAATELALEASGTQRPFPTGTTPLAAPETSPPMVSARPAAPPPAPVATTQPAAALEPAPVTESVRVETDEARPLRRGEVRRTFFIPER